MKYPDNSNFTILKFYPQDPSRGSNWYATFQGNGSKSSSSTRERKGYYADLGKESDVCGSKVVVLQCERFLHLYGKRLYCGREWCPICGEDESKAHKRRYGRMMHKVFYLGHSGGSHGLGYWVFTVPPVVREKLKRKEKLQLVGRFVRGLLREHDFEIGISGWHRFGDGEIKEGELDLGVYHPHENCIVVGRWVTDKEMASVKEAYRKYLESISGELIPVVDVWYQYFKDEAQWWHKGRYITRPTFKSLEGDNFSLVSSVFNFRNIVYWGWGQKEKKQEKERLGLTVLKNWIEELKAKNEKEREEADLALSILSEMLCPQCFALDSKIVKLVADSNFVLLYQELTEGLPTYLPLMHRRLRGLIQKEYDSGFLILYPWLRPSLVILNIKPMFEDWFCSSFFDTS